MPRGLSGLFWRPVAGSSLGAEQPRGALLSVGAVVTGTGFTHCATGWPASWVLREPCWLMCPSVIECLLPLRLPAVHSGDLAVAVGVGLCRSPPRGARIPSLRAVAPSGPQTTEIAQGGGVQVSQVAPWVRVPSLGQPGQYLCTGPPPSARGFPAAASSALSSREASASSLVPEY